MITRYYDKRLWSEGDKLDIKMRHPSDNEVEMLLNNIFNAGIYAMMREMEHELSVITDIDIKRESNYEAMRYAFIRGTLEPALQASKLNGNRLLTMMQRYIEGSIIYYVGTDDINNVNSTATKA